MMWIHEIHVFELRIETRFQRVIVTAMSATEVAARKARKFQARTTLPVELSGQLGAGRYVVIFPAFLHCYLGGTHASEDHALKICYPLY